jgi:hypothetical protein
MVRTWLGLVSLAAESQHVIWLRCLKLARGGPRASAEARRMSTEKLAVAARAAAALMSGGTPAHALQLYRASVRANRRRLSRRWIR